jgi:hypothetical protein
MMTREQQRRQRNHLMGLALLRRIFRADYAEFYRQSAQYINTTSRATKKGHIHKHQPAGSKLLKRFDRQRWQALREARAS